MQIKFYLISFVSVILCINCFAWDPKSPAPPVTTSGGNLIAYAKATQILPSSPNASQLGRYGDINIGYQTGQLNLDIPIHTIKLGEISIPVGLSHSTGGLRVDELQTSYGYGWALQAGGVITRTVKDAPDEASTWQTAPTSFSTWNLSTFQYLDQTSTFALNSDNQFDEFRFSFLGGSGSFILDESRNPILMQHSTLKIQKNFTTGATWNFLITDGNGIKYYFGGAAATEMTRNNHGSSSGGCGIDYQNYTPTAWYITRIELPTGKYADFTYEGLASFISVQLSSSYVFNYSLSCDPVNGTPPPFGTSVSSCINTANLKPVFLKKITASNGEIVDFNYSIGCPTYPYCAEYRMADLITISSIYSSYVQNVALKYTAVQSNGVYDNSMISESLYKRYFLQAVQFLNSQSLVDHEYKLEYFNLNNLASPFSFSKDHWGFFNGKVNANPVPPPSPTEAYLIPFFPSANANREIDINYAINGSISKMIYPTGGYMAFEYESNSIIINPTTSEEKAVGGLRIKRIRKNDGITNVEEIRRIYYGKMITPTVSSGSSYFNPRYYHSNYSRQYFSSGVVGSLDCSFTTCDIMSASGGSVNNLYLFDGPPAYYNYVTESMGENFENGGTEFKYQLNANLNPAAVLGNVIMPGAQETKRSYINGLEIGRKVFRKNASTSALEVISETANTFKWDTRVLQSYQSYITAKKFDYGCQFNSGNWNLLSDFFIVNSFWNDKTWVYLETTTSTEYDLLGNITLQATNQYFYDNPAVPNVSRVRSTTSKGEVVEKTTWYPSDYGLTFTTGLVTNNIVSVPIKEIVTRDGKIVSGNATSYLSNGLPDIFYAYEKATLELPPTHSSTVLQPTGFIEKATMTYADFGNLIQARPYQQKAKSYIWDYNKQKPVAEIINAESVFCAYSSFETGEASTFTYGNGFITPDATSPTGKKCFWFNTGSSINKSGLITGLNYVISYWSKNGIQCSIIGATVQTKTGKTIDGWTYYEHAFTGTSTITLYGTTSTYIDEVRLFPKGALMTTYVHDGMLGLVNVCDANNSISYYEYDNMGRLKAIRDQDKNIVKTFDYKYQQPQ
jgi:YD repeat-containing protein